MGFLLNIFTTVCQLPRWW